MSAHHHGAVATGHAGMELDVVVAGNLSMLVVFAYDYLLNLSREVELMWQGTFQFTTVLYLTARYLPFFGLVYFLGADSKQSFCTPLLRVMDTMSIVARTSITVTLTAQTYALYNQSRFILVILGALALVVVAVDGYEVSADTCAYNAYTNMAWRATLALIMLTAFSATVMGLTLYKVIAIIRQKRRSLRCIRATDLTRILLLEGISLSAVCLVRLFNILLLFLSPSTFGPGAKPFMLPIAATIISHFLLDLRDMNGRLDPNSTSTKSLAFTTIRLDRNDERTSSGIVSAEIMRTGPAAQPIRPTIIMPGSKHELQAKDSWQETHDSGSDRSYSGRSSEFWASNEGRDGVV